MVCGLQKVICGLPGFIVFCYLENMICGLLGVICGVLRSCESDFRSSRSDLRCFVVIGGNLRCSGKSPDRITYYIPQERIKFPDQFANILLFFITNRKPPGGIQCLCLQKVTTMNIYNNRVGLVGDSIKAKKYKDV